MKAGPVAKWKHIAGKYHAHFIVREFDNGYLVTITRLRDNAQLVYQSNWKWILNLRTRRRILDYAFWRMDWRDKKSVL